MIAVANLVPTAVIGEEADAGAPESTQVIEPEVEPRKVKEAKIDSENFEIDAFFGVISIDNFSSEPVIGARAAFHATEDFFLQLNYGRAEAGLTSFEELNGIDIRLLTDSERVFQYYDFSVGYNIFPGEIFVTDKLAFNSAIYLLAGVGNTRFAGEDNFTVTLGTGYRVILLDWLAVNVDFRDHIFNSDLIQENQTTHNLELTFGISFFF